MNINIWAVLVNAVIFQIIGFIWYGPLFGKKMAELLGMPPASAMTSEENKEFQKKMIPTYITQFLLAVITVFFIGYFIDIAFHLSPFLSAFYIWLGFMLPFNIGSELWSGKTRKHIIEATLLNGGYNLVVVMVAALIFSIW